jgi:cell wall-associated NlpC family hydrolase
MLRQLSRGVSAAFLIAFFSSAALANPNTDPLGELLQTLNTKADGLRNDVVVHAMSMVGVLYRRGGNNEETGFDCSGLVKFVFGQAAALALPRTSREQSDQGAAVQTADLQPGDLVFYNTLKRPFSHVGIYVGQGQFVHSPRTGAKVRLERMSDAYWTRRFEGARRLFGEGG